jgi:hypothetical protein
MLYAAVHDHRAWPLGLEELEYLKKKLKHLNYNYRLDLEVRMFALSDHPEYRYVLMKFEHVSKDTSKRIVLLETHDTEQMASALKMLVSIEETEMKQRS